MDRSRRTTFREQCPVWNQDASGRWYRFPSNVDRFTASCGVCVYVCDDWPCLHESEKEKYRSKRLDYIRRIWGDEGVETFLRKSLPKLPRTSDELCGYRIDSFGPCLLPKGHKGRHDDGCRCYELSVGKFKGTCPKHGRTE